MTKKKANKKKKKTQAKTTRKKATSGKKIIPGPPHHVVLTSHPNHIFEGSLPINWGAKDPLKRGPVVASLSTPNHRNAIGTHSGSYTVYHALTKAAGNLDKSFLPDLTNTHPVDKIGPFPSWYDPKKIVSLDPWGAQVHQVFSPYYKQGYDIRPTIAITKAHIKMIEIDVAIAEGRLQPDGEFLKENGDVLVTKAAIEPVWYLPGIADRLNISEGTLRQNLFQETGGMFPELVTRPDLKTLLPPIGGNTAYLFGDPAKLGKKGVKLTVRVHDECNGSDVFGSDICTCRPYLIHGIEEAVKSAQQGGLGLIIYFRKEGRALGEVTKFLVYNARKRQKGGDTAANYFTRTECVAGVEDMRFQQLMPDALHWFGVQQIDNLVSMSNMKYDAIVNSGIKVVKRTSIPDEMIPQDAMVEMEAKKAAGYFNQNKKKPSSSKLKKVKGRKLSE